MITSHDEMRALQRVAELEPTLAALEQGLARLAQAMCENDADAIESRAAELHRALAQAVDRFSQAARTGVVPGALRHRLARAGGQVAAQRDALARATAALDRAIDVMLPSEPLGSSIGSVYASDGTPSRRAHTGQARA